jgi:hypothetical protein
MPHYNFKDRFMASVKAFRQPALLAEFHKPEDFSSYGSRRVRYDVLWGYYENTIYDNWHYYATPYKKQNALYKSTRGIYNPANRLGNFHQTYIWGGALDPQAGDGEAIPSALPIITENEDLRPAISKVWEWSNWQIKKDNTTLKGAVCGDVGIKVIDDVARGKVYLQVIQPHMFKSLDVDEFGNVKSYVLEWEIVDANNDRKSTTFTESAIRGDNDDIIFRTFKDGKLFAWDGDEPEWVVEYGFMPLVHIKHIDNGFQWGWAEMHAGRVKFDNINDVASKLDDQIRKLTEGLWMLSGVKKSETALTLTTTESSRDKPQPGREDQNFLYAKEGASATSLVSDIPIGETVESLQSKLEEIERDYPELQDDIWNAGGDTSGRALIVARQQPESKIQMRRPNYDNGLVRAQQMAIAIGGARGYDEAFNGFDLDSFEQGELDHTIGQRPVFVNSVDLQIDRDKTFWETANQAIGAGMTLDAYLESQGWSEDRINQALRRNGRRDRIDLRRQAREAANRALESDEIIEDATTTAADSEQELNEGNE